jgi:hypothetical protein
MARYALLLDDGWRESTLADATVADRARAHAKLSGYA